MNEESHGKNENMKSFVSAERGNLPCPTYPSPPPSLLTVSTSQSALDLHSPAAASQAGISCFDVAVDAIGPEPNLHLKQTDKSE